MKLKPLAALVMVLLMVAPLAAQDKIKQKVKSFRNGKRFSVKYDRFKDHTWVTIWFRTGEYRGGLFTGAIGFKGETPKDAPVYFFTFELSGKDWRYLSEESRTLYAIIDGERMELGTSEHKGEVTTLGMVGVHERLVFPLDAETFSRLANGKSVESKIGSMEFKLKDEHQEAFRDLMSLATIKD